MNSVIPNKLKEELEDVGKVYNSRSGMCVYPNAFSRLQTEIMKICNENKMLKEGKTNVFAELNEETEKSNEMLMNKVADLESQIDKMNDKLLDMDENLCEAKDIIKDMLDILNIYYDEDAPYCMKRAIDFLKDTEIKK